MRKCPYCNENIPHLKKHLKKSHPEEYKKRYNLKRPRTHEIETLSDTFLENRKDEKNSRIANNFAK